MVATLLGDDGRRRSSVMGPPAIADIDDSLNRSSVRSFRWAGSRRRKRQSGSPMQLRMVLEPVFIRVRRRRARFYPYCANDTLVRRCEPMRASRRCPRGRHCLGKSVQRTSDQSSSSRDVWARTERRSDAVQQRALWRCGFDALLWYLCAYNQHISLGCKQSGIGRELGSYALEEYTTVKAVHWNFGEKLAWPL